jgi:hypothetical protein
MEVQPLTRRTGLHELRKSQGQGLCPALYQMRILAKEQGLHLSLKAGSQYVPGQPKLLLVLLTVLVASRSPLAQMIF